MNTALSAAHGRARAAFLAFSDVLGVAVGPKGTAGRVTAPEAIVVLVARKLPRREVPRGELIPPVFDGFPTDVREPVLNVAPLVQEGKGSVRRPAEWCLTDAQWIDWTKIRRLNQEQHQQRRPSGRPPSTRRGRGPADH